MLRVLIFTVLSIELIAAIPLAHEENRVEVDGRIQKRAAQGNYDDRYFDRSGIWIRGKYYNRDDFEKYMKERLNNTDDDALSGWRYWKELRLNLTERWRSTGGAKNRSINWDSSEESLDDDIRNYNRTGRWNSTNASRNHTGHWDSKSDYDSREKSYDSKNKSNDSKNESLKTKSLDSDEI